MNAIAPFPVDAGDAWNELYRSVNSWRGQAIHYFARAELAVSEALLALAGVEGRGSAVRLRRLVGQRFQDLQDAVGPDGPFSVEGNDVARALAAFREHEPLRSFLCHGVARVTVDRRGEWVVVMKLLAFRGRAGERTELTLDQRAAEDLIGDLKDRGRKLVSALGAFRAGLGRSAAASG